MEKLLNVDFLTRSCGERILLGAVCIETLTELHPKWRTLERLVVCPLNVRHLTRNRTQTKSLSNTYKLYHANNLIKTSREPNRYQSKTYYIHVRERIINAQRFRAMVGNRK